MLDCCTHWLYTLLMDHHKLFCRLYGKWEVTVNYHNYVPPHTRYNLRPPNSFWCFSYERFNGILAGSPNSNRNVKVEVANRFVRDFAFSSTNLLEVDFDIPTELACTSKDSENQQLHYPITF